MPQNRYGADVPSRKEVFENFIESLPAENQREALLALGDGYPMKTAADDGAVHSLREKTRGEPVPASLGNAVEKTDVEYVAKHWQKLLQRLASDPEGAVTSARAFSRSASSPRYGFNSLSHYPFGTQFPTEGFDVLDRFLSGTPIGRIVAGEATKKANRQVPVPRKLCTPSDRSVLSRVKQRGSVVSEYHRGGTVNLSIRVF